MPLHRPTVLAAAFTLAALAAPPAAAQQPTEPGYGSQEPAVSVLAPNCRFINYYLWPTEAQSYECCASVEPRVVSSTFGVAAADPEAGTPRVTAPRASVTVNRANPRVGRAAQATCVNLSELTPLERVLRQVSAFRDCVRFVVYDHFPCQCETQCNDPSWFCDCPGIAPGELPEIGPQDSLGSQPELLGTVAIPCGTLSSCEGSVPPGGGSQSPQ